MIYFTSDLHFGHNKEFIYKERGFNSIEEHDGALIKNWNNIITNEDIVYILGDLMLGDNDLGIEKIKQLKGQLKIILGNHCTANRVERYKELNNVEILGYADIIKYKKYHFYLSHYPTLTANLDDRGLTQCTLNIFGHTHQKSKFYEDRPHMYCVCVDAHEGYPVNIDTVIEDIKEKYQECINQL